MLIVYGLVCEKLTIFPYAECTMECCIVRFKFEVGVEEKSKCKNGPRDFIELVFESSFEDLEK